MKLTYLSEYHFFNETIMPESPVVLVIGLMGAKYLYNLKKQYPSATIVAYEAEKNNALAMRQDADAIEFKLVNKALASKNGKVTLYKYKSSASHSIFPRHEITPGNPEYGKVRGTVKVDGVTLMQIMKDQKLDYVDLLIMNCEGAEMFALNEIIKKKTLRDKVGQICVSFHSPRIYSMQERDDVAVQLFDTHHHYIGGPCPSIPDHLFIRKV